MARQAVKIKNNTGLHARPAADFAKLAKSAPCEVYVEKEGKRVNAKSILGILSLAIRKDNIVDIITEGEEEDIALDKLVSFIDDLTE
jgi:phosphotransferase system HPr (HPr) family protein